MSSRSPIALSSVLAVALAVAAGPAAALGLGQIQVKSQPGQPLVAEIPIISSDPAELQGLQVQLASPETFSRVGLEPPQGVVSSLRFEPALDDHGHPVIRVTSPAPVQQPLLTFLLEVDWGEGRLVREYSALLDTPRTVAAPIQAPIQAPTVAPSNTIVRPVVAPVAAVVPQPAPAAPVPVARSAPTAIPMPPPAVPTPPPVATAPEPTASPVRSSEYGPVRPGQTLGEIAANLDDTHEYSVAQIMLALLRANPDAFIGGNINRLKRGAVLHVPQADELAHYNQSQAAAVVREQMAQWRDARRPSLQPAAVATSSSPAPHNAALNNPAPHNSTASAKPARTADARLEILPPSGRDQRAGANKAMRSGIQAGGEGEMLRQQLQETKESLAARDAEVNELKTRVADLEKLQQQQQQLITLKDSALATAQQSLAASNRKATTPAPVKAAVATTTAQAPQPTAPPQPMERSSGMIWLWGGLVLIFAALAGWLLTRRRHVVATPKRGFDTAALAASIPVATREPEPAVDTDEVPIASFQAPEKTQPPASVQPPHWTSAPVAVGAVPTWHGGAESAPGVVADANDAGQHDPGQHDAGRQLELAQAYLDLGDEDAARALLREVLDGHDPAARKTAALLLRDL